jgi:spore maturation protein CgeB
MRTFEIPVVGGFMLHEYSEEAIEFFEPGVEADYFKSPEECADKIKFYLKNEALRQIIANAGHEKIFSANHLYTDRVEVLWKKFLHYIN